MTVDERHETDTERLDRNWGSLIQELRVVETGVQFLTGFLLVLPFQTGFAVLSHPLRLVYLVTVGASIGATVFIVAPVSWHRILFRRHRLGHVVSTAHRCAMTGLGLLGVAMTGVILLVFHTVLGPVAAVVAGAVAAVLFAAVWLIMPWRWRRTPR
ncbi:DUF6328 family protein [Nocardia arthritidis]|uniref:Sodium:proton antiporter n=1 Tax=Nocardia arthritidis TaxID=228602 RepID=A0A6G9YN11_9NOCA|nr:DUF6328 family protein [Nocardia arthritidis]QIS14426.1 hypothetical protein F5544_32945 [Nocardia arthritidis]